MPKLTEQDRALLRILQEDGRITNQELAERTGMSASVCWRRVRAMEEAGIISKYAAIPDPTAAGLNFQAIVHVSLARTSKDYVRTFMDEVRNRPEVLQCFAIAGTPDYHLLVMCEDLEAYNRFYTEFLFERSCVGQVSMHLIVNTLKSDMKLPV
ncbi:Lrp/AsnC family transcriptional regulator [Labrenzia sp. PHM005]|uniref:Lrp/AsnC family transcriptional regulator n=1 Tax=Labrenzia sp. PHM005 TaxID=2590016 RepID=UPI001140254E|nr:Lrp/AsnC family transcriptional regulator [Labrenzia sp. PHM005]QDG78614.1 Lrp/AsnC family transcriptional regulator [Labrenzia sp. PHM005]